MIDTFNVSKTDIEKELVVLRAEISVLRNSVNTLKSQVAELQTYVAQLNDQQGKDKQLIDRVRNALCY